MPNVPQHVSLFAHTKDVPCVLVDEKMTIEVWAISTKYRYWKKSFCPILEDFYSIHVQPKENSLLKIMESQSKLATESKNTFSKSSGDVHNDVKIFLLSQFEEKGAQRSFSNNQGKNVNILVLGIFFIHHTDRHTCKMRHTSRFFY